jgi:hypothetical protein
MVGVEELVDTADRLGVLDAIKAKLVKQPDPAAAKLVTVLEELSKIYGAIDDEFTNYLSLFFDDADPRQLARERAALARLEGGEIRARMAEARGRCSKITNIYDRYLTPWFDRVVNPDEALQLQGLFRELYEVDSHMVDAITGLSDWLAAEAEKTNDLVERDALADANARIDAARQERRAVRQRTAEAMIGIRRLESEFIEVSGAV